MSKNQPERKLQRGVDTLEKDLWGRLNNLVRQNSIPRSKLKTLEGLSRGFFNTLRETIQPDV